jgi:hypothetical protein
MHQTRIQTQNLQNIRQGLKMQRLLLFAEPPVEAHGRTRIHAEERVSQEKSQVSPYIGKEAVEVVDDVLLPLAMARS